jgi:acyl-CoA thioesterase-1
MKTIQGQGPSAWTCGGQGVLALILAGLLAACGGGSNTASPVISRPAPALPASVPAVAAGTWVVMGSSTAAGSGASAGKAWVDLLGAAYGSRGAQVANIAQGGTLTYEGLSAATAPVAGRPAPNPALNIDQALARKPVLLIVSYPTNDTALGYSVEETVNNLLAIRSQALAAGVPVVLTSTQPRNLSDAQLAQLRAIDTRLAASVGACFVELRAALAGAEGRLAPAFDSGDGVHPNNAGHEQIWTEIRTTIESGRCIKVPPQ